ncbi:cysteine-rich receptor-like protein kinase 10 [Senna tora]|uniref:Cysteine-rich receptor-like protein kinase 10 n=1 Tax=Senna tora TaxID=362788 RepID=A0A834X9Q8_9FABA|nr:cysteine-rich receptor-like protein kinase 10 [Senna tora]
MCRGDVPSRLCHDCVQHATKRIVAKCPYNKEAIIWYEECMLRYSDRSFFSTLQTDPRTTSVTYSRPVSESDMEDRVLRNTVNDVAEEAAKSSGDHAKFAIKEANVSSGNNNTVVKTLYTLAQCTPDLSTEDCHDCLRHIIQRSLWSPEVAVLNLSFERAEIFYPTCNLMFGSQRFYYKDNAEPVTSLYFGSGDDSTVSSSDNLGFYNTTVSSKSPSNTVYGLFMCRGDISPHVCHQCVGNASQFLPSDCQFSKEAILWLNVCMLRYSNHYFFSKLDTSPKFNESTMTIENKQDNFNQQLAPTLDKLVEEATKSGLNVAKAKKFFATEEASSTDTDWETLYTLAQCTPDLSTQDCATCLKSIVEEIKSCCLGKRIVEFMYPSCNMRFDLYPFYNKNNTVAEAPTSTPTRMFSASADKGKEEGQSRIIIIVVVVVLIVVSLMLFGFTYYILRRKRSMRYKAMLEENCSQRQRVLSWSDRYKIIAGIARGILYLHEHSRLKAWKQWSGGNWPEILDSNLIELESYSEVIRCIQIGLLCVQENPDVRPTMNTVVQYLSNDSIQLPFPQEPAFFLHDRMDQPTIRGMESHSREHATNDSEPCSINEMSMSNFFPR